MHQMTDAALAQAMDTANQNLATLRQEYADLGERILAENTRLEALKDEQTGRSLRSAQEEGAQLDWGYLLEENQGQARYKACMAALSSLGLQSSGYFPETEQRAVKIALLKNDTAQLAAVAASLQLVMPAIKPLDDGWCYISIFEHTLSQFASYKLRFRPDQSEFQCIRRRYSQETVELSTPTLPEMLAHIQKAHYYE